MRSQGFWLLCFICRSSAALRGVALAPRAQLRVAARGAELVARAVAGAEPAADKPVRSFELNKPARDKADDKAPRKPRREVTVKWDDLAPGKTFKGVVVRPRRLCHSPSQGFLRAMAPPAALRRLTPA